MLKLSALVPLITLAIAPDASRLIPRLKTHPWSGWRPGATVEFESEQKVDGRTVDRWKTIQTLAALTADTAEIREVMRSDRQDWNVDLMRSCALRNADPADLRPDGEETITVAGRRIRCRVLAQHHGRFWVARDGGPIHLVKAERTVAGVSHRERIVAWDEPVPVGGRTVACVRTEEVSDAHSARHVTETWLSPSLPGSIARARCVQEVPGEPPTVGEARAVRWA